MQSIIFNAAFAWSAPILALSLIAGLTELTVWLIKVLRPVAERNDKVMNPGAAGKQGALKRTERSVNHAGTLGTAPEWDTTGLVGVWNDGI